MSQNYKIEKVSQETRRFEAHGKSMVSYKLMLSGIAEPVELVQIEATPAPKVGDELYGFTTSTSYGLKFKKERQPDVAGGGYKGKPADSPAMYISYAKDIANKMLETKGFDEEEFNKIITAVANGGELLWNLRPDATKSEVKANIEKTFGEGVDEPIDLKDVPF